MVGLKISDGIIIKGYKTHFIDRIIGEYKFSNESINKNSFSVKAGILSEKPRQGVHIKDAKETLLKGAVGKTMTNTRDQKSVVYIGDKCNVTINTDTGMLIKTNPSK